jgi:hypothetical protein
MDTRRAVWIACLVAAVVAQLLRARAAPPPECAIKLLDATASSGITFRHTDGGTGQQYLFELMVAGLAIFDFDGDGLNDVFFLNGATAPGESAGPARDALYQNRGGWRFVDVAERAGVGDLRHGLGVTAADYDNDGDLDLYVNNYGPNVLYRNEGDGTFSDVTEMAGVGCGAKVGAGVCFLDVEGDGDLDLYVAHYVEFSYELHARRAPKSFPYPPGPRDFPPVPDSLFLNNGDGTFTDVSAVSGIASVAGPSMGMVCLDYDDDGDTDIFVGNDGAADFLFRNDGSGRFEEVGLLAGAAYNARGEAVGSMGVDAGDYDNDGQIDLFVTDYTSELPVLYRNLRGGWFEDVATAAGAGADVYPHTKWGTGFADFENDGDRDLFIANGHFLRNIREIDDRTDYRVRNCLLMNLWIDTGAARFLNVSAGCGDGLAVEESSRGAGFDDLDNDGDLDAVVLNANARPTLLRNESGTRYHWLQIGLRGTAGNRGGVGARVRVTAGDLVQVAEVHSGRGYQGHHGTRLQFGLGRRSRVDRVEVRWPGGRTEVFTGLTTDRLVLLTEGTGSVVAERATTR